MKAVDIKIIIVYLNGAFGGVKTLQHSPVAQLVERVTVNH